MLSALDLARRIEAGELSPRAVFARCVEAIAARDKDIGAFVVYLDVWEKAVGALEDPGLTAPAVDGPLTSSRLRGLPVAKMSLNATGRPRSRDDGSGPSTAGAVSPGSSSAPTAFSQTSR